MRITRNNETMLFNKPYGFDNNLYTSYKFFVLSWLRYIILLSQSHRRLNGLYQGAIDTTVAGVFTRMSWV